jgi:hypothetical protein
MLTCLERLAVSLAFVASLSCAQAQSVKKIGALTLDRCDQFAIQHAGRGPDFDLFSIHKRGAQRVASAYLGNHPERGACYEVRESFQCSTGFKCFKCFSKSSSEIWLESEEIWQVVHVYGIEPSVADALTALLPSIDRPIPFAIRRDLTV